MVRDIKKKALDWLQTYILRTPRKRAYRQFLADDGENIRYVYALSPESKIFDVGAFQGEFSERMLQEYGANIWAFEPHPKFHQKLSEIFQGDPRVTVLNYGLGARSESLKLSDDSNSSSFLRNKSKKQRYLTAKVLDIGEFLNSSKLEDIDLIKLNVEGMEFDIVSRLIDSGLIVQFKHLQIQWHRVSKTSVSDRNALVTELRKTHKLDWAYDWVWESWSRK